MNNMSNMNLLTLAPEQLLGLVCIIAAAILVIGKILINALMTSETVADDPELLAENQMEYRNECLNRIISFILASYNIDPDTPESDFLRIKCYQEDLEVATVEMNMGQLIYYVCANYRDGRYIFTAQEQLFNGQIVKAVKTLKIVEGEMADFQKITKFIKKFEDKRYRLGNKTYEEVLTDVREVIELGSAVDEPGLQEIMFLAALNLGDLMENFKYRNKRMVDIYTRLMVYICGNEERRNAFIAFAKTLNNDADADAEEKEEC